MRAVSKISCCQVYAVTRKELISYENSFGSIFLCFLLKYLRIILTVDTENP